MFSLGRFFGACLHFWKSAVSKSLSSIQSVARLQSEQEAPSVANMICQQISVQKHIIGVFMLMWSLFALEIISELSDTAGEVSGICANTKTMF